MYMKPMYQEQFLRKGHCTMEAHVCQKIMRRKRKKKRKKKGKKGKKRKKKGYKRKKN